MLRQGALACSSDAVGIRSNEHTVVIDNADETAIACQPAGKGHLVSAVLVTVKSFIHDRCRNVSSASLTSHRLRGYLVPLSATRRKKTAQGVKRFAPVNNIEAGFGGINK